VGWYWGRNVWWLTNIHKCLILLVFVGYEAVRLWWWGGNYGVVDFEKTPLSCSIPTPASNSKLLDCSELQKTKGITPSSKVLKTSKALIWSELARFPLKTTNTTALVPLSRSASIARHAVPGESILAG
jgi:hypothetical protein